VAVELTGHVIIGSNKSAVAAVADVLKHYEDSYEEDPLLEEEEDEEWRTDTITDKNRSTPEFLAQPRSTQDRLTQPLQVECRLARTSL